MFFRATEPLLSRLPSFVGGRVMSLTLRAAGVRLGKASSFWGAPRLNGPGDFPSRLSIGEHCGFNVGCYFELDDTITIDDHVSVGHDVMFLLLVIGNVNIQRMIFPGILPLLLPFLRRQSARIEFTAPLKRARAFSITQKR